MKKKIILFAYFIFLFLTSFLGTYFYQIYSQIVVGGKEYEITLDETGKSLSPTPTPDPLGPQNTLVMGYGGEDHDGGYLTDTMIVAHIVPREKSVTLISLPRDIWAPLPVTKEKDEHFKINAAYAIGLDDRHYPQKEKKYDGIAGGGNMAKDVVSTVVGLPIHHFVAVDFQGFKNIVNIFGGVKVRVPYTFDDKYYPVKGKEDDPCGKTEEEIGNLTATMSGQLLEREFPCRYEELHFDRGFQEMDAETALKFVRSRHSDINGGDFARSQRQQAFLIALKEKILRFGSITKLIPLGNQLAKNVLTDIDIKDAFNFARQNGFEVTDFEINTISINTDNALKEDYTSTGQYILVPTGGQDNWKSIHEYIQKELEK